MHVTREQVRYRLSRTLEVDGDPGTQPPEQSSDGTNLLALHQATYAYFTSPIVLLYLGTRSSDTRKRQGARRIQSGEASQRSAELNTA